MKAIAEERMKVSGFSGRLIVLGDPEIRMGDGRLEWADGGLVRDINAISNEINTRISAYLAARGAEQGA
jgi:flagellar assembly protein FliH